MKTITQVTTSGIIALSLTGLAMATPASVAEASQANQQTPKMELLKPAKLMKKHHHAMGKCRGMRRHNAFARSWRVAMKRSQPLTPKQAKTVAQAGIILFGNRDWQVGTVTAMTSPKGYQNYQVQIMDKQGNVLNTVTMNGLNGRIMFRNK